jgi:hypothetical protein
MIVFQRIATTICCLNAEGPPMTGSRIAAKFAAALSGLLVLASAAAAQPRGDVIAADALRADLRFALDAIARLHPDPGHSIEQHRLARIARRIEARLDRPMTRNQAWAVLAQLNPVLADGHLLIGIADWRGESQQAREAGSGFFPFEVALTDDLEVRIVSALGGAASPLAGRRLRRINGVDAGVIARVLLARMHGDTPRFRRALLAQRWWLYFRMIYGAPPAYDLELAGPGPRRMTVEASLAVPETLRREAEFERQFRFELLPNSSARLTINSFSWPDKERFFAFTRQAFATMRTQGTRTLEIDVSQNSGGDDDMWRDGILRYIADRPYRNGSRYLKRVIEGHVGEGEVVGQIVHGRIETQVEPVRDEPLHFAGEVRVVIGALTYSSAVLFSNVVHDYGFGRLVGIGGAARRRQSGSVQTLTLPNSGLVLSYPRFVLDPPSGPAGRSLLEPSRSGGHR